MYVIKIPFLEGADDLLKSEVIVISRRNGHDQAISVEDYVGHCAHFW